MRAVRPLDTFKDDFESFMTAYRLCRSRFQDETPASVQRLAHSPKAHTPVQKAAGTCTGIYMWVFTVNERVVSHGQRPHLAFIFEEAEACILYLLLDGYDRKNNK